jgi:hypothetical protein
VSACIVIVSCLLIFISASGSNLGRIVALLLSEAIMIMQPMQINEIDMYNIACLNASKCHNCTYIHLHLPSNPCI